MVRLGEATFPFKYAVMISFNSSMVRLGERFLNDYTPILLRFNSSMVRLGVRLCCNCVFNFLFQFQYGAIGSMMTALGR